MKKHSILLSILLSLATGLYGQGTFMFQNKTPNAPVFDASGQLLAGANYAAELYGGATSLNLTPALDWNLYTRIVRPFLTGTSAGYFQSGASHTVFDIPPGGYAWLQVKAWDARLGATYADVEALGIGGYGESNIFYAKGGAPTNQPADPPAFLIGLQSFSLRPVVPEPSELALLGLGGFALWCFARQRR